MSFGFASSESLFRPTRSAREVAIAHGLKVDRCEILQNGSTLVLRLSESLVARVVQDCDGPRQGTDWFERENAVASHLTQQEAPVIPLHWGLPAGPHVRDGYPMNFWEFVKVIEVKPAAEDIGRTLFECHKSLRSLECPLPRLGILHETRAMFGMLERRSLFSSEDLELLCGHLERTTTELQAGRHQALHGDAHLGNLMNTDRGLLWTDWEDAFSGPVEWDLASVLWNAKFLENDGAFVESVLGAYRHAGGSVEEETLRQCWCARAAVMTAWYPLLYPNPNSDRREKLQRRLEWLRGWRDF